MNHYNHFKLRREWNYHEEWKSYSSKLVLLEVVVKTKEFDFFPLLKRQHKTENIDKSNPNMFESWIFKSECESIFQIFLKHGEMFTFILTVDETEENILDLLYFNVDDFSLEMFDFKSSALLQYKFKALRNTFENSEDYLSTISMCWTSLLMMFSSLKINYFCHFVCIGFNL